jgi:hypothetical protein
MIPYEADAEDPKEQADGALRTLCDRADGATCKGAGGCIDVLVAADVETDFPWDAAEQKLFMGLTPEKKLSYTSTHESEWPGISDVYRLIYSYQFGKKDDGHLLFFHDSGSCTWRKREGCEAHQPWRGPSGMMDMLDAFAIGMPPTIIPSKEPARKGSYARALELYRRRGETVAPDQYNPRKLMDDEWKNRGLKKLYMESDGQLPESKWQELEDKMLADRPTIKHDLAHLAALARGDVTAKVLEDAHKARGIDKAVDAYVRSKVTTKVVDEATGKVTDNVNKPHITQALVALAAAKAHVMVPDKRKLEPMRKASLVQLLFEKAGLASQQPTLPQQLATATAVALPAAATPAGAIAPITAALAAGSSGDAVESQLCSDEDLGELAQEVLNADEEAAAHRAAAEAALQQETEARLGDDAAVAMAVDEPMRDEDAHQCDEEGQAWAQDESINVAAALAAAEVATEKRKKKLWRCAECGQDHTERSAVRKDKGSYVCLERCGMLRAGKRARPASVVPEALRKRPCP